MPVPEFIKMLKAEGDLSAENIKYINENKEAMAIELKNAIDPYKEQEKLSQKVDEVLGEIQSQRTPEPEAESVETAIMAEDEEEE